MCAKDLRNCLLGDIKDQGIGAFLRDQRKRKKYTQEHVAEAVGLSDKHYSRIEAGRYVPNLMNFLNILEVLDLNLEDFTANKLAQRKAERDIMHLLEDAKDEDLEICLNIIKLVLRV